LGIISHYVKSVKEFKRFVIEFLMVVNFALVERIVN